MASDLTDVAPPTPGAPRSGAPGEPGATYDDVFDLLTDISERLKRVEAFCNDVQTAVNSMPAFPFMPKFPKVGAQNGGR